MKRKSLVCVFAHPDDEAFGPGGTIATFAKDYDVYILCATKGEAGGTANVREQELLASSKILGVKHVNFLGFTDGTLCNSIYHDLVAMIKKHIEEIKPELLLTFEPRGVSGHIDHIVVSMVTTYYFEHQKRIKKLLYFCTIDWQIKIIKTFYKNYFVYHPPGYKKNEIDLTVDISSVWKTKVAAMKIHKSQIHDVNRLLLFQRLVPKKEYFLVLNK